MRVKLKRDSSKSKAKAIPSYLCNPGTTVARHGLVAYLFSVNHSAPPPPVQAPVKNRGRVDIIRQKAGRGGKVVTVVANFTGIGLPEKEKLARQMQKACGTGGTVKDGKIEIQGDKREEISKILQQAGFRPVFAGG